MNKNLPNDGWWREAVAISTAIPACPDDFGQGTGQETFISHVAGVFGKQVTIFHSASRHTLAKDQVMTWSFC